MQRATAIKAKVILLPERKAGLADLVKAGKITQAQAELIDVREPTVKERALAESLLPTARRVLARRGSKAA